LSRTGGILSFRDVGICLGRQPIVNDISFELHSGGWYGLVGVNGCGKTTIMRAALGLLRPVAGCVRLFGVEPPPAPGRVGVTFGPRLAHPQRRARTELWLRIAALRGSRVDLDRAWEQTGLVNRRLCCGDLSLGQAQRLAVVSALIGRPDLVVLDEPTVGLDVTAVDWLREQLQDYVAAGGCAWVSSHDLAEVERCADEVIVVSNGAVVHQGSVTSLVGTETVNVALSSSEPELLRLVLDEAGIGFSQRQNGAITAHGWAPSELGWLLARRQVPLLEMRRDVQTLESSLRELLAHSGSQTEQ
jgi:ABC-2 type transport system ATP-binding protein